MYMNVRLVSFSPSREDLAFVVWQLAIDLPAGGQLRIGLDGQAISIRKCDAPGCDKIVVMPQAQNSIQVL